MQKERGLLWLLVSQKIVLELRGHVSNFQVAVVYKTEAGIHTGELWGLSWVDLGRDWLILMRVKGKCVLSFSHCVVVQILDESRHIRWERSSILVSGPNTVDFVAADYFGIDRIQAIRVTPVLSSYS